MTISTVSDPDKLNIPLPKDARINIEDLLLGYYTDQYSYVASVTTDSFGNVSGGGTRYRKYKVYDFGFSLSNKSNVAMRVSFHLQKVDRDGYTLSDHHVWGDVEAGEKKRMWAGLRKSDLDSFREYNIKSVHIGQSPYRRTDGATWTSSTHPNANLYDAIQVEKAQHNKAWLWLLLIAGVAFMLVKCVG